MMRRHTFNLIEILMALGVLMIGVVSIMALFPLASKVTSDAAMETYVPNAMEQISSALRAEAIRPRNWDAWLATIPTNQPDAMLGKGNEEELLTVLDDNTKWTLLDSDLCAYLFKSNSTKGIYQLISVRGNVDSDSFDFSKDAHKELIESRVLICVWRSQISRKFRTIDSDETPYDKKYGVRLNIKAGWPAERPEARITGSGSDKECVPLRKIRIMSFDVLNPVPNP